MIALIPILVAIVAAVATAICAGRLRSSGWSPREAGSASILALAAFYTFGYLLAPTLVRGATCVLPLVIFGLMLSTYRAERKTRAHAARTERTGGNQAGQDSAI